MLVVREQLPPENGADDTDNVDRSDRGASSTAHSRYYVRPQQLPGGGDDSGRDPEQSGNEAAVAQSRDDDRAEGNQSAIRDVLRDCEER